MHYFLSYDFPLENLYDISTWWSSEYVAHVANSAAHMAFLFEVIRGNDENILSLIQPWTNKMGTLPDLEWESWFLQHLDKQNPLQVALEIDSQSIGKLSSAERVLFDSFL